MPPSRLALYSLVGVALALASPAVAQQAHPSADPVIAAERAFAARGQEVPVKQAFLAFAAPDGVMVDSERGAENAHAAIAAWPDADNAGWIKWWPIYAGIARSGELGFTTGPATYGGDKGYTHFFTVWKKQADGSWKWLIDMGGRNPGPSPFGPDTPVSVAPPSSQTGHPDGAWSSLKSADEGLAAEAAGDLPAAYARRLADDSRIMGMESLPAVGREAFSAALQARPRAVALTHLGGGVANSGELGWTYGTARWSAGDRARQGVYLRVWQKRPQGWVILVDNLTPDRP